jgi:hypothetical protein
MGVLDTLFMSVHFLNSAATGWISLGLNSKGTALNPSDGKASLAGAKTIRPVNPMRIATLFSTDLVLS